MVDILICVDRMSLCNFFSDLAIKKLPLFIFDLPSLIKESTALLLRHSLVSYESDRQIRDC